LSSRQKPIVKFNYKGYFVEITVEESVGGWYPRVSVEILPTRNEVELTGLEALATEAPFENRHEGFLREEFLAKASLNALTSVDKDQLPVKHSRGWFGR
jgi:hypothetical protein